jgi:DNA (cytosine-5)-methyltransferase 1
MAEVRAFLLKYYGTDQDPRLDDPLHSVTTKDRFGLVAVTIAGEEYVIVDIGMRMLTPRELFAAQDFPADYIIDRDAQGRPVTKTAQVARCGNSVCPPIAEALVRANMAHEIHSRLWRRHDDFGFPFLEISQRAGVVGLEQVALFVS